MDDVYLQAYKNDAHLLSQQFDEKVAKFFLPALGAVLIVLTVDSGARVFVTECDTSLNDSITRAADVMIVERRASVCRYSVVLRPAGVLAGLQVETTVSETNIFVYSTCSNLNSASFVHMKMVTNNAFIGTMDT